MTTLTLLKFNGVVGANSFIDETGNQVWSPHGLPVITDTDSKFGGKSLRTLEVDNSYIDTVLSTPLTGDFTIEFWHKYEDLNSYYDVLMTFSTAGDGVKCALIYYESSNQVQVIREETLNFPDYLIQPTVSDYDNYHEWNHFALCRKNGATSFIFNGIILGVTEELIDSYTNISLGNRNLTSNSSTRFPNGWFDSLRITDESIYNTNIGEPSDELELLYIIHLFNEDDGLIYNIRSEGLAGVSQVTFDGSDLDNSVVFLCDDPGGGGGVIVPPDPDPTSTNIITGNVKKFGLPYSLQLVAVSVELIPEVYGSTMSDIVTGDYSIDVYPWEGDTLIYATPDYGDPFAPSAFIAAGEVLHPTVPNKNVYIAQNNGNLGLSEPAWPESGTIVSGDVTFLTAPLYRPLINGFVKPVVTPI